MNDPHNLLSAELARILADVKAECRQAMLKFPSFNSAHEGYAVLLEEVDELWEHVKMKQGTRNNEAMQKECIQIAAMALRFAYDICLNLKGLK